MKISKLFNLILQYFPPFDQGKFFTSTTHKRLRGKLKICEITNSSKASGIISSNVNFIVDRCASMKHRYKQKAVECTRRGKLKAWKIWFEMWNMLMRKNRVERVCFRLKIGLLSVRTRSLSDVNQRGFGKTFFLNRARNKFVVFFFRKLFVTNGMELKWEKISTTRYSSSSSRYFVQSFNRYVETLMRF